MQRLIDEAELRYIPEVVAQRYEAEAENRRVEVDVNSVAHVGIADLNACPELAHALDLEAALSHCPAKLKQAGSTDPLPVRKAHALGDLARAAQAPERARGVGGRPHWDDEGTPRTGVRV